MPRIVIKSATGPFEVKTPKGDSVWICGCGLTDNPDGTCNGNHKKLNVAEEDPDKLYQYDDGERLEVAELVDEKDKDDEDEDDDEDDDDCCGKGCCGGGCGGVRGECCDDEKD